MNIAQKGTTRVSPYKMGQILISDAISSSIMRMKNRKFGYYIMAESVFAMQLVILRSVTCYTDQNFKENAHFGALNLFTSEKKVEIKL